MESDSELSHSAARVGWLVGSYVYNHDQLRFRPAEPFPLPWTVVSRLCFGMSQRQVYRAEWELVNRGYLIPDGTKGDRNTSHFRLALHKFSSAKNGNISSAKNGRASSANCDKVSSATNGSPPYKLIPSEEIDSSNGRNSASRNAGEFNSSLRSTGTKGDSIAAPPTVNVPVSQRLSKWEAAKQSAGLSHLAKPQATATVARSPHPTKTKSLLVKGKK